MNGLYTDESRAFWVASPGRGEIRAAALHAPGPGQVVVRAIYSGISRGTESLVFRGMVPASEYQRMRAPFQEGEFPGPVKYGYASVGTVEEGDAGLVGRTVFVLYEMEGMAGKRIAEIVAAPEATVWRRLHGARQVFRSALEAEA